MVELIKHTSNSIFTKNPIRRVFPNPVTYMKKNFSESVCLCPDWSERYAQSGHRDANVVAKLEFKLCKWLVSGKGTKVNWPAIEGTRFAL